MFIPTIKRALLLLCLCANSVIHADTTPEWPPLHQSVYNVKKYGTTLGEMTNQFSREQDKLHYTSSLEARGLAALFVSDPISEHSILRQAKSGAMQQLSYTLNNPQKKRKNENITFNRSASAETQIKASYRNKNETIRSETDTFSRQLLPLLMSRDLLQNNSQKHNQFEIVEKASLERYSYQLLNEETLRYNGESLSTLKFRIDKHNSNSMSYVWLAKATDYLPVKIDQYKGDDLRASLLLKNYTRTQ